MVACSRGGSRIPKNGHQPQSVLPTYYLANFSWKVHENKNAFQYDVYRPHITIGGLHDRDPQTQTPSQTEIPRTKTGTPPPCEQNHWQTSLRAVMKKIGPKNLLCKSVFELQISVFEGTFGSPIPRPTPILMEFSLNGSGIHWIQWI